MVARDSKKEAMNREQWIWMRASVALMAAAAAALRESTLVKPVVPQ
jgi:hypothetical protein